MAPSHYLKQCGLIIKLINKVMWHLSQWITMKDLNIPISKMRLKLICWDNFTPSQKSFIYSAVIIVLFVSWWLSWYLLSSSLIPMASVYSRGTRSFVTTPIGGNVPRTWKTNLLHEESVTWKIMTSSVNSLALGKFQFNIRKVIFKLTLVNGGWCISYEIALRWMPQDLTDDKSTFVQVMAWCRQATSHYLSQCWPRSMSPYGVTRPQWVKVMAWACLVPIHVDLSSTGLKLQWIWFFFISQKMHVKCFLQSVGHFVQTSMCWWQLIHCGLVTSYGDRDLGQHWLR